MFLENHARPCRLVCTDLITPGITGLKSRLSARAALYSKSVLRGTALYSMFSFAAAALNGDRAPGMSIRIELSGELLYRYDVQGHRRLPELMRDCRSIVSQKGKSVQQGNTLPAGCCSGINDNFGHYLLTSECPR